MRQYMQWIIDTQTETYLPGQDITYAEVARRFREYFSRDSAEYEDLFNFYTAHAGERAFGVARTRKLTHVLFLAADCRNPRVMQTWVEAMFSELLIITNIQSSLDGDMHQYIQYILKTRPRLRVARTQSAYKQVLQTFLEQCPRGSRSYRKVFAKFYASRHSNHSDDVIQDFVAEVELQTKRAEASGGA